MSQIYKEAPSPSKAEMGSLNDLETSTKTSIVGAVNEINGKLVNATSAEAGLMSASDKSKLDGIATGATANVVSDSLSDTSTTNALSAAKGKELNDSITTLNSKMVTITADIFRALGTNFYCEDADKARYCAITVNNKGLCTITGKIKTSVARSTDTYTIATIPYAPTRQVIYSLDGWQGVCYQKSGEHDIKMSYSANAAAYSTGVLTGTFEIL